MKILMILLTIFALLTVANTTYASDVGCDSQYLEAIQSSRPYLSQVVGQGSDGMGETFAVATAGTMGLMVGGPIGGAAAGGATAAAIGINVTVKKIRHNNLKKAFNVIREAKIGDGLALRKFVSELSLQNSFQQTRDLIITLDEKGALCSSAPLSYPEMKELTRSIGMRQ